MCLLSSQPNKTEEKEQSIAAFAHYEGQSCLHIAKSSLWILDSAASDHICCDISLFQHYDPINNKQNTIVIPDGSHAKVKYIGSIRLNNGLTLKKVLYVLDFQYNLVSIHRLCLDNNAKVTFVANNCVMQELLKKPLLLGRVKQ